jgi:hypothetical protein
MNLKLLDSLDQRKGFKSLDLFHLLYLFHLAEEIYNYFHNELKEDTYCKGT